MSGRVSIRHMKTWYRVVFLGTRYLTISFYSEPDKYWLDMAESDQIRLPIDSAYITAGPVAGWPEIDALLAQFSPGA